MLNVKINLKKHALKANIHAALRACILVKLNLKSGDLK
jgi:hypothetical protein